MIQCRNARTRTFYVIHSESDRQVISSYIYIFFLVNLIDSIEGQYKMKWDVFIGALKSTPL